MKKILLLMALSLIFMPISFAQMKVFGKITLENNEDAPIGATVAIFKDSRLLGGTATDVNGNYEVKVAEKGTSIKVNYMGYKELEFKIDDNSSEIEINAALQEQDF